MILFFPFQNEMKDIHEQDIDKLYKDNEEELNERRALFEKHKVMTDIIDSIEKQTGDNHEDVGDVEEDGYIEEESTTTEELESFESGPNSKPKYLYQNTKT